MRTVFRSLPVPALLVFAAIAILVSARDTAEAAGFHVNVTYDAVDANPGDFICETAAGNGECTLRAAVMEANALPGADLVTLGEGEYEMSIGDSNHEDEDTGYKGDLDLLQDLSINGAGPGNTIVKGRSASSIIDVPDGATAVISGLTLTGVRPGGPGEGTCGSAVRNMGALTLQHVRITDNFARHVGAVCNGGMLTMVDSSVSDNRTGLSGWGAGMSNGGTAELIRVEISGNGATYDGGGIYNTGSLTISDSLVQGNAAQDIFYGGFGGGVYNDGGDLSVINTTFTDNSGDGGAIANTGSAVLVNVTIANNRRVEDDIGGIYNTGDLTLTNTIVANNEGGDCSGAATSGGHNLDSDGTCDLSADGDLSGVDPMLGELADNGGPTMTQALLEGSPAIDAGVDDACPETDQRGAPRPADGDGNTIAVCDIGAYEAGGVVPPTPTPTPVVFPSKRADIDCDDDVDGTDALALLRFLAGVPWSVQGCPPLGGAQPADSPIPPSATPTPHVEHKRGDINCDGVINVLDALAILRYVAGMPVAVSPGCGELG